MITPRHLSACARFATGDDRLSIEKLQPIERGKTSKPMKLPTPYKELNKVLDELVAGVRKVLVSKFIGAYLQGSFATGWFDQHSDVDFVVVINSELSPVETGTLQLLHIQVYDLDSEWAKHLEGSYFPKEILRRGSSRGQDLWYLEHGARPLGRSNHCNTLVVRSGSRPKARHPCWL
jgi:predicted nucleotidyltransferase